MVTAGGRDAYYHLDKSALAMLVSIIMVLIMQTGTFVWWASKVSTTIETHDHRIAGVETWRALMMTQNEMLVRLETKFADQTRRTERLEAAMDYQENLRVARKGRK
jgi:hypothetical protein